MIRDDGRDSRDVARMERPLLVFAGDCGFCRACVERGRRLTRDTVEYAPSREVAARFPGVPPERFAQSVVLIEPDGRVTFAAEAVFRVLACVPGWGLPLACYRRVPGFAAASERAYAWVSRNRGRFGV